MSDRNRPLTDHELWQALYEDSSGDEKEVDINESDSEDENGSLLDDQEEDDFIQEEPKSEDEELQESMDDRAKFFGRNGFTWYAQPLISKRTRTSVKNLVVHLPGSKGKAKEITSVKEFWQLFFSDDIIETIVNNTNQKIRIQKSNFTSDQRYINDTNKTELMALFGLLYFAGVLKNAHLSLEEMWSEKFGVSIFRYTMTKNRFSFLLTCLRFDDTTTRVERKAVDKFAPIREIWNTFTNNCEKYYVPSEYVTVDEQLLSFRGRCPFKMYLPSKPDKYGLKIIMMCDAKTSYMCSAIPYVGKDPNRDPNEGSIPTQYVLKLTSGIQGTNRNVTMDNWFSSCELAEKLLDKKLTMVGTLRKNKKELPTEFLNVKRRQIPSSAFAFSKDFTLVSHVSEKKRCVLLLSSMHFHDDIHNATQKPEIIMFYNSTKGGVDVHDQLCHSKTVARKTRRWPLRIFYGMLDTGGVNSLVLYRLRNFNQKVSRSVFLKNLAAALVEDHMKTRATNDRLPRKLRQSIRDFLGYPEELPIQNPPKRSRRCDFCPRVRDRKGRHICVHCGKNMCAEHQLSICEDCKN